MAEHRFSSQSKKAVCLLDAVSSENSGCKHSSCVNFRSEETVQILKHSRMAAAGVLLTPTVLRCACEFHGRWNWASPEMVPSQFCPREEGSHCPRTMVCEQRSSLCLWIFLGQTRLDKTSTSDKVVKRRGKGEDLRLLAIGFNQFWSPGEGGGGRGKNMPCVCTHMHVCALMSAEARGQHLVSFSFVLHHSCFCKRVFH